MENRQIREQRFWNKFATNYDLFIKKSVSKTYDVIFDQIELELNSTQRVLDIGTGTGIIPFSIYSKVHSIVAADISPEMIHIAKKKQMDMNISNIDFQVQDSYSLSFPDETFDVVIANNLLHLLYEPEIPLAEVRRVLKPDGLFIAPTFCVGEDFKSKLISGIAGRLSGFKIVNKWCISDFKKALTMKGWGIKKAVLIRGRFPLLYVVMTK